MSIMKTNNENNAAHNTCKNENVITVFQYHGCRTMSQSGMFLCDLPWNFTLQPHYTVTLKSGLYTKPYHVCKQLNQFLTKRDQVLYGQRHAKRDLRTFHIV